MNQKNVVEKNVNGEIRNLSKGSVSELINFLTYTTCI